MQLVKGFPSGSVVKNPPAKQKMQVQSLAREDPLEKETTTTPAGGAWWAPVHRVTRVGCDLLPKQ